VISIGLIVLQQRDDVSKNSYSISSAIAAPFQWLSSLPGRTVDDFDNTFVTRERLILENERLSNESLILQAKVQKLISLTAENVRLRELLSSSTLLEDSVLVAEIIGVAPTLQEHKITINKGEEDGVYPGQAIIDAYGLVGQVTDVEASRSSVILISDVRHALPVQVNRNGVRAIVEGTGRHDTLRVPNLVETTDIKSGDLLISSGLGQRFPVGYPVGQVESVESDPGKPFMDVIVRPSARLDRGRYLLLVFSSAPRPEAETDN